MTPACCNESLTCLAPINRSGHRQSFTASFVGLVPFDGKVIDIRVENGELIILAFRTGGIETPGEDTKLVIRLRRGKSRLKRVSQPDEQCYISPEPLTSCEEYSQEIKSRLVA